MKKPTTIYLVAAGCYSDYGIHAAFSTRELAQKHIDKAKAADDYMLNDDPRIEEWVLDELKPATKYTFWSLGMFLDNGAVEYEARECERFGLPQNTSYICESVPVHGGRPCVRVESHKSAEHALKFAAEKRQEWLRKKA